MDDELFGTVYQIAWRLWPCREKRVQYASRTIVLMYLWSVIRGKPQQWVCQRCNLPRAFQDQSIPGRSQFGRRLKNPQVHAMLAELETHLRGEPQAKMLGCWLPSRWWSAPTARTNPPNGAGHMTEKPVDRRYSL